MSVIVDCLLGYLERPSVELWQLVRIAIAGDDGFDPNVDFRREVFEFLDKSDFEGAVSLIQSYLPSALLYPEAHLMLAFCYEQLGDSERVEAETGFAQAIIRAALITGEGTMEAPWGVTTVGAEYDILEALELESVAQSLEQVGELWCDRHELADGSSVWFELGWMNPLVGVDLDELAALAAEESMPED